MTLVAGDVTSFAIVVQANLRGMQERFIVDERLVIGQF